MRRLLSRLLRCKHPNWHFPVRLPGVKYPEGFDSIRACASCGRRRFYSFRTLAFGPYLLEKQTTRQAS